jgi:hypothetical protein
MLGGCLTERIYSELCAMVGLILIVLFFQILLLEHLSLGSQLVKELAN